MRLPPQKIRASCWICLHLVKTNEAFARPVNALAVIDLHDCKHHTVVQNIPSCRACSQHARVPLPAIGVLDYVEEQGIPRLQYVAEPSPMSTQESLAGRQKHRSSLQNRPR